MPDLPPPQCTLQDLVITTTPNGVVVHWPNVDLSPDFKQGGHGNYPAPGVLPFQEGRNLTPEDVPALPTHDDPTRQLFVIITPDARQGSVSSDEASLDGETTSDRRILLDLNAERRLRHRNLEACSTLR